MRLGIVLVLALAGCRTLLGIEEVSLQRDATAQTDGGAIDSAIDGVAICPAQCSTCKPGNLCEIDCTVVNCNNAVSCPAGFECDIKCSTANSCRNGLDCTQGISCKMDCSGQGSCRSILCGPGACTVSCTGQSSCEVVACGSSCACDVSCDVQAACNNVSCTSAACEVGTGCSSTATSCDSCP